MLLLVLKFKKNTSLRGACDSDAASGKQVPLGHAAISLLAIRAYLYGIASPDFYRDSPPIESGVRKDVLSFLTLNLL